MLRQEIFCRTGAKKAVQVTNLSQEQIDKIARAIGDSFFDHDYGDREKGIVKYIADREMMFRYMRAIFAAGVKSGTVYATSERGEGYVMLSGTKFEKMKIGPALVMLKDMIKALGGLRGAMDFLNEIKVGGISLEDKLKKGLSQGGNVGGIEGIPRAGTHEKADGICL